jgi:hypothetical protein
VTSIPQEEPSTTRASTGYHKAPRLAIVYRCIAELKLNPDNPRLHSEKQIQQIGRSIQAFGFNVPILVDRKGRVLAGHGRVLAALSLGLKTTTGHLHRTPHRSAIQSIRYCRQPAHGELGVGRALARRATQVSFRGRTGFQP